MFENYPTYAKQVLSAARSMSAEQKARHGKIGIASVSTIVLGGIVMMASGNALAAAQIDVALETLKTGFEDDSVAIEVESAEQAPTTLLAEESRPLSANDEAAVAQQVKDCISADKLASAEAKIVDNETTEVTVTTSDNIPVKITLKKGADGAYRIASAKAVLDADAIRERKAQAANPVSSDVQKSAHAAPLAAFDAGAFAKFANIAENADDAAVSEGYAKHMSAIAPDIVLTVPDGFSEQEVEQPADARAGEGNKDAVNEENVNAALAQAVDDVVGEEALSPAELAKAQRSSVKQYARSWKNGSGSTISVRAENLGEAFSGMTGIDAVTKMRGYWEETSSSVANGANQTMKNPDEGYVVEVFYDEKSGVWGYWGHVVYTDGTRDIVYNRVVMIDEISDQMFTISYRNDSETASENKAYTLDQFKQLVTSSPVAAAPVEGAVANAVDKAMDVAVKAYNESLDKILILPGHTKTVEVEKKEAAEAAEKAKSEEAAKPEEKKSEGSATPAPAGEQTPSSAAAQPAS